MQKTSSVKATPTKRSPRARKNPFGLFDEGFLKDALIPAAIGAGLGHIGRSEYATKYAFWHRLDLKWRIVGLVLAAVWLRRKKKPEAAGACLGVAGQYAEQWFKKSKMTSGLKDMAAAPPPAPSGEPVKGLSALIDYEMQEAVGALFEGADDAAAIEMAGLSRLYEPEYELAG